MEIIWFGHSCFRLKGRDAVVLTDPYGAGVGASLGKPAADILTVSHHHPNHDNVAAVGGTYRLIDGPGEYEVKGVIVTGIRTYHDAENGRIRGKNTAYLFQIDDLVVCHLGDLGHVLTSEQVEAMSDVDILIVPVGGGTTINAAQAAEVISQVEPKVVIPMHFRPVGSALELEPVDRFLRQMSAPALQPQPRFTVSAGSLPDETQVVLLEPRKG